jgi:hypothetical protein
MLVLIVLLAAWLIFRAIGSAGVHVLASWQHSALYALAVMFVFTATAHFNKMKHDLAQMIPASFPRPLLSLVFWNFSERRDWCSCNFAGLRAFDSLRSSSGCSSPM